jgi:AraC-like DNA-binding protein
MKGLSHVYERLACQLTTKRLTIHDREVQSVVAKGLKGVARFGRRDVASEQVGATENEEASQRVGMLAEIPSLLRELRTDPAEVAASAGLDPDGLDALENRIPFVAIGRLLHYCAVKTGYQHFALLLGQRARLSHLGLPGQLARHSPTLGAAIGNFAVYEHLDSQGLATFLLEKDGVATVGPVIYQKGAEHGDQIYDLYIAATLSIMRELCGARWRPERVLFSHSKPPDVGLFRRSFEAPCQFNAERTALVLPANVLDHRLQGADSEQFQILEAQAHARDDFGVGFRLRRTLRILLLAQGASGDQVARLLLMHHRTLNRRLKAEGTTFQELLDEVRFEAACQLLDTARIPITEIAVSLGYAETSAFSRAFRRWSGTTPVERRRRSQKKPLREARQRFHAP